MSDQALKILVELGVIGEQDVKAAQDLLRETGRTAQEAAKNMNGGTPENLAGWENYKNRLHEAGGEAGGLKEKLHELRGATKFAGPEFAEVGHLLHAAFNPVALTTAALVAGIEAYFHWVEKSAEKTREMGELVQKWNDVIHAIVIAGPSLIEQHERIAVVMSESRTEAQRLAVELKRVAEIQKGMDDYTRESMKDRLEDQQRELDLLNQRLALLKQMGVITDEQKDIAEAKNEHQKRVNEINAPVKAKETEAVMAADDERKLAQTVAKRFQLGIAVGGGYEVSSGSVVKAQENINAAEVAFEKANTTLHGDTEHPGEIDKRISDLRAAIAENEEKWHGKHGNGGDVNPSTHQLWGVTYKETDFQLKRDLAALEREGALAKDQIEGLRDALNTAKKAMEDIKTANQTLSEAHKATEKAQHDAGQAATEVRKPGGAMDTENQRFGMELLKKVLSDTGLSAENIATQGATARDRLRELYNQTGLPYDQAQAQIKSQGEQARQLKAAGQQYDQAALDRLEEYTKDQTQIERLNILLNGLGQNAAGLIKIIQAHERGITDQATEIAAMKTNLDIVLYWMGQRPVN